MFSDFGANSLEQTSLEQEVYGSLATKLLNDLLQLKRGALGIKWKEKGTENWKREVVRDRSTREHRLSVM